MTDENDPYRLCCCHGHLDGLSLDEMRALGAPCPTEKAVQERVAQAWDECARESHDLGWLHDWALSDLTGRNPYRVIPPAEETR